MRSLSLQYIHSPSAVVNNPSLQPEVDFAYAQLGQYQDQLISCTAYASMGVGTRRGPASLQATEGRRTEPHAAPLLLKPD